MQQGPQQDEARFADFARAAGDWFWQIDAQFRFVLDTAPVPEDEPGRGRSIGLTPWELPGVEAGDPIWAQHRADLAARRPIRDFVYSCVGGDGRRRHIRVNGAPIFAPDGTFCGYRGTAHDITERRQAELRLLQSQKMEAVGQLTGGIAHDFNNLLQVILGNLEIAREQVDKLERAPAPALVRSLVKEKQLGARLDAARQAAMRGAELTQRLLAFGRRQVLRPEPTDVNRLISDMTPMLSRVVGERVEIRTIADPHLCTTRIDRGQLVNAILDLAINARDAMPDGGQLVIETANVAGGDAGDIAKEVDRSGATAPGPHVMLAVSDTGHGMAPDVAARAFEPFFTTKEPGQGPGLGLAMVHGFVKQSGGFARIHSEPGKGTAIRLYLPWLTSDAQSPPQPEPELAAGIDRHPKVLLLEDEASLRDFVGLLLRELGCEVTFAENGRRGLELVRGPAEIDLLLTDITLPGGLDGVATAAEARRLRPGLKVLFMSGYAEGAAQLTELLRPGENLLTKPFSRADLARLLQRSLRGPV